MLQWDFKRKGVDSGCSEWGDVVSEISGRGEAAVELVPLSKAFTTGWQAVSPSLEMDCQHKDSRFGICLVSDADT